MPLVNFTYALKRFYPNLKSINISASNIGELVQGLEQSYPGLKDYLIDEQGRLRQHVNIFIGGRLIKDKQELSDNITESDEIFIMQALSGG